MDWKKLGLLGLAVALLAGCFALWQTERRLDKLTETVETLRGENAALEETVRLLETRENARQPLVEDFEISVLDMDRARRTMTLFFSLALSREEPEGVDIVARLPGDDKANRRSETIATPQVNGRYTGRLTLPADTALALEFSAETRGSDTPREERFCSVSSLAELLPLRLVSGGGDVHYNGERGTFYWTEWMFSLKETSKTSGSVAEPLLRVYKNGKLAAENPCGALGEGRFADKQESSSLSCEPGDKIAFRFACVDDYGLGYEFPVQGWEITPEGESSYWPADTRPSLSWKE